MGEVTAMHHTTIRRVLLLGAFTTAGAAGLLLADQADAHAADRKPAVEQPGGLLHRAAQLPEQAVDRAEHGAAKVVHPKRKPASKTVKPKRTGVEAKPTPKPCEDTPAPVEDAPAPGRDRGAEPAPPVELPPVELPPVELPPLPPVEVPPVKVPPVVTKLPPVDAPPAPLPTPLPDLPAAPPGQLPAIIGPAASSTPPALASPAPGPAVAHLIATLTAGNPNQPALCADDARPINRGALRALLRAPNEPPAAERTGKPCQPSDPSDNADTAPAHLTGQTGAAQVVADVTGSHVPPILDRLEHTRARSHLPASRHTAVEPGPA